MTIIDISLQASDSEYAAASLAIYLRAGQAPPSTLVNGTSADTVATSASYKNVPSVLLTPEWVVPSTIKATVIKDKVITVGQLCTSKAPVGVAGAPTYAKDCSSLKI